MILGCLFEARPACTGCFAINAVAFTVPLAMLLPRGLPCEVNAVFIKVHRGKSGCGVIAILPAHRIEFRSKITLIVYASDRVDADLSVCNSGVQIAVAPDSRQTHPSAVGILIIPCAGVG